MDPLALPPVATVLDAAYRALMSLTHLLEPLLGGLAASAAVVVVSLATRALLIPVGIAQAKAERTRAQLAPRLAELQREHKNDAESLQRATMKLYTDEGTTPWAGCLPLLIQAPVVGIIYTLFLRPQIAGHPNTLLEHSLSGAPLGSSLVGSLAGGPTVVVFATVAVLILLVGELTRRASMPGGPLAPPAAPGPAPNQRMQQLLGALQFATAVVACVVPLAAALYLLVTVAWTLVQRVVLRRRFPLDCQSQPPASAGPG